MAWQYSPLFRQVEPSEPRRYGLAIDEKRRRVCVRLRPGRVRPVYPLLGHVDEAPPQTLQVQHDHFP
eukprot:scaffold296903_cov27-Tisochrysis_lutea.AAC.2